MKKILFVIISSILFLNTFIAAGLTINETDEVIRKPILSENLIGSIPTILKVNISVGKYRRFECRFTGDDDIHLYDWCNETEQKVKVVWVVNSLYEKKMVDIIVWVRIQEWIGPMPWPPRDPRIYSSGYPRFVPIKIPLHYGSYTGEKYITVTIVPYEYLDVQLLQEELSSEY